MKFSSFKEFRQAISNTIEDVVAYLNVDHTKMLRELNIGLTRLNLQDNFDSFTTTETIPATSELAIRNELRGGVIPRYWLPLRRNANTVVDGDTEWNANYVYLKNTGASAATVTVVFFR